MGDQRHLHVERKIFIPFISDMPTLSNEKSDVSAVATSNIYSIPD